MKNIIFIAPPSAGKGTQSAILVDKYGYIHISTGDLLRAEAKKDTPLGRDINEKLKQGMLISDDITNELVKNIVKDIDSSFILDGYPRTLDQAIFLDELIDDNYVTIYLNISQDEAMKRALGRATCDDCKTIYNIYFEDMNSKEKGICDHCNGALVLRSDDNEESFKKRFEGFEKNTLPLVDYYKNKNQLEYVEVLNSPEETFEGIEKVIR